MLRLIAAFAVTLLAAPALAAATPWQDIAPGVRARMITADAVGLGKTRIGLELDLPPGTKTYWRIPGETGIPTQIDIAGSAGLSDPVIAWPFPEVDDTGGFRNFVYHGHVVLPVDVTAAPGPALLNAAVTLGVCSDVCIPAQAQFTLPLTLGTNDPEQALRLQMALQATPIGWDQPQEPFGRIAETPDGLSIAGIDPLIDPQSLIVTASDPSLVFSAPQKSPDGTLWLLHRRGAPGAEGLAGRSVELTFMTRLGPYAVSRPVAAAR